jgi:hypothetical protein
MSPVYSLQVADLADLPSVEAALSAADIDMGRPTLFLSECVMVYMDPKHSDALIQWIAGKFTQAAIMVYEQIRPYDAFGKVMMDYLATRGCPLKSLPVYPDIPSVEERYLSRGWKAVSVADMNDVYYKHLPRPLVAHGEKVEIFDELEEWHLMAAHYSITIASTVPPPAGAAGEGEGAGGEAKAEAGEGACAEVVPGAAGSGQAVPVPSSADVMPSHEGDRPVGLLGGGVGRAGRVDDVEGLWMAAAEGAPRLASVGQLLWGHRG